VLPIGARLVFQVAILQIAFVVRREVGQFSVQIAGAELSISAITYLMQQPL
jgi:hypothetical protein